MMIWSSPSSLVYKAEAELLEPPTGQASGRLYVSANTRPRLPTNMAVNVLFTSEMAILWERLAFQHTSQSFCCIMCTMWEEPENEAGKGLQTKLRAALGSMARGRCIKLLRCMISSILISQTIASAQNGL